MRTRFARCSALAAGFVLAGFHVWPAFAGAPAPPPFPGNDSSYSPAVSADGRYVAFMSLASNLVPNDTNGVIDVFVLDRSDDSLVRASTNSFGGQADGQSWSPSLSADGRYVAFASNATNLVAGDTNFAEDVFRKDLVTGTVERASLGANGVEGTSFTTTAGSGANVVSISGDGRFVAFQACLNGLAPGFACGGYVRDLLRGETLRYSEEQFSRPALGARDVAGGTEITIAFTTSAARVASDTNGLQDVYLARTVVPPDAGGAVPPFEIRIVSALASGNGGNGDSGTDNVGRAVSVSADGQRIAFVSEASDLSPGDTNGELDAFLYVVGADAATSVLTRETDGIANFAANTLSFPSVQAALSPDGLALLYFDSGTPNDGNWLVKAVPSGPAVPGSIIGTGAPVPGTRIEEVGHGAISNGGLVAAWQTLEFDLPATRYDARSDVFVSDGSGGAGRVTSLASRGRLGTEADGHARVPSLSGDGAVLAYSSHARGTDPSDPGANRDVFVRTLATGAVVRASSLFTNIEPVDAYWPDLDGDGDRVAFVAAGNGSCADGFGFAWVVTLLPALSMQCADADTGSITGLVGSQFVQPAISDDGNWVAFAGSDDSAPGQRVPYLRDLANGVVTRLGVNQAVGFEYQTLGLSGDGRYLVHSVDFDRVAVYDRALATDTIVSRFGGDGAAGRGRWASISADGEWIAFVSEDNLAEEDPAPPGEQVYLVERATQAIERVVGDAVGRRDGALKARTRLSADGRRLAYVLDDLCVFRCASRAREVVLYDRVDRSLRTVSLTPSWGRPNGPSAPADDVNGESALFAMDLSGDGAKVAFGSSATNLAPSDENAADDIYVVEVESQSVALGSAAAPAPAGDADRLAPQLSGDGDTLAYAVKDRDGAIASSGASSAKRGSGVGNKWSDVAIQSTLLGEVVVSKSPTAQPADGDSGEPSISANGALVAFQTDATNLTTAGDGNGATDIVLFDGNNAANVAVSKSADGTDANGASFDPSVASTIGGKWGVSFTSTATNLGPAGSDTNGVPDVLFAVEGDDGAPPTTVRVSVATDGSASNAPSAQSDVAPDASFVTFASLGSNLAPGDTNGTTDVFMRNLATQETALISAAPGGAPANGPSSGAVGDKFGTAPSAPPIVAFETDASNLVGNDLNGSTDIVAWTPSLGTFVVSRGLDGVPANGTSTSPQISRGGRWITFVSTADNLVAGDTNNRPDVFVYDTTTQAISRISRGHLGQEPDDVSTSAAVAMRPGGQRVVAWDSAAQNLGATQDTDAAFDLFVTVDEQAPEPILMEGDLVFRNGYE